jgi:hypothetical protein
VKETGVADEQKSFALLERARGFTNREGRPVRIVTTSRGEMDRNPAVQERRGHYGILQRKLAALSVLPLPAYVATCG